ncbi:MAG: GYDIA family GHMP kinase [Gelidibacter sp.]
MNSKPKTLKPETLYSNGKLLLTGEYMVLDGALSLALPTKLGQSLQVEMIDDPKIIWSSLDEKGNVWFDCELNSQQITSNSSTGHNEVLGRLIQILYAAKQLNPEFLSNENGFKVTAKLDFPKNWGLGTSSTLINNIANWANVDAYGLLQKTFGGSGYDIACAKNNSAITFQKFGKTNVIHQVNFNPSFVEHLYFVYLNKKQNSRDAIAHYKSKSRSLSNEISEISQITEQIIKCENLKEFERLLNQHETIISNILGQKPIKELHFQDFKGSIKSLGAWGGDFVLVASDENPSDYFKAKGFETVIGYPDLILH